MRSRFCAKPPNWRPMTSPTQLHFARALADAGQTAESAVVMDRFRQLGPAKTTTVTSGLVQYLSLTPEARRADYRARVEAAVAKDPSDGAAQLRFLQLSLDDGRMDQAADAARRIAGLKPDAAAALEQALRARGPQTRGFILAGGGLPRRERQARRGAAAARSSGAGSARRARDSARESGCAGTLRPNRRRRRSIERGSGPLAGSGPPAGWRAGSSWKPMGVLRRRGRLWKRRSRWAPAVPKPTTIWPTPRSAPRRSGSTPRKRPPGRRSNSRRPTRGYRLWPAVSPSRKATTPRRWSDCARRSVCVRACLRRTTRWRKRTTRWAVSRKRRPRRSSSRRPRAPMTIRLI